MTTSTSEMAVEQAMQIMAPGEHRRFTLLGDPTTWSSKRQRREELAWAMNIPEPMIGNVAVACVFYRATRHRIDVDNMLKDVLDAGTHGNCWKDDHQVTAILGLVELDAGSPRTVIYLGAHTSTMDRRRGAVAKPCEQCGKPFKDSRLNARFCSSRCSGVNRANGVDLNIKIPCGHCGAPFRRRTTNSKYCQASCRRAAMIGRNQTNGRALPLCESCGVGLSKHGYRLCRKCWQGRARVDQAGHI